MAFVDKLASQNNGVNYLLVAVDFFSRFVRVKTMKTKISKVIFSQKNTPEKRWVDKGTEYGGLLKNFARRKTMKFF